MLEISRRLEKLGVPTKRGGLWRQSTIHSILTNPLYIGKVRYSVGKKNYFEVESKNIEPIIDNELFFKVEKLLDRKREKRLTYK